MRPAKDGVHLLRVALEERFDRAVSPVSHPARHTPPASFIAKRVPVAHSLDVARDDDMTGSQCKNVRDRPATALGCRRPC